MSILEQSAEVASFIDAAAKSASIKR